MSTSGGDLTGGNFRLNVQPGQKLVQQPDGSYTVVQVSSNPAGFSAPTSAGEMDIAMRSMEMAALKAANAQNSSDPIRDLFMQMFKVFANQANGQSQTYSPQEPETVIMTDYTDHDERTTKLGLQYWSTRAKYHKPLKNKVDPYGDPNEQYRAYLDYVDGNYGSNRDPAVAHFLAQLAHKAFTRLAPEETPDELRNMFEVEVPQPLPGQYSQEQPASGSNPLGIMLELFDRIFGKSRQPQNPAPASGAAQTGNTQFPSQPQLSPEKVAQLQNESLALKSLGRNFGEFDTNHDKILDKNEIEHAKAATGNQTLDEISSHIDDLKYQNMDGTEEQKNGNGLSFTDLKSLYENGSSRGRTLGEIAQSLHNWKHPEDASKQTTQPAAGPTNPAASSQAPQPTQNAGVAGTSPAVIEAAKNLEEAKKAAELAATNLKAQDTPQNRRADADAKKKLAAAETAMAAANLEQTKQAEREADANANRVNASTADAPKPTDPQTESEKAIAQRQAKLATELGDRYLQEGNYSKAMESYIEAAKVTKDTSKLIDLATKYIQTYPNSNYSVPIMAYKAASEIKENDVNSMKNLGYSYYKAAHWQTGDQSKDSYQQAANAFQKAIDLDPKNATLYSNLGFAYIGLGNYKEAEAIFKKALELNPNNDIAMRGLSRAIYGNSSHTTEYRGGSASGVSSRQKEVNEWDEKADKTSGVRKNLIGQIEE